MRLPVLFVFVFLYLTVAISSLLVTISVATLEGKLDVQCGLYITIKDKSVSHFTYTTTTAASTCQFVKFMPAVVFVLFVILMVYHLYPAVFLLRNEEPRYEISTIVCWVIMVGTGILLFVEACIVSVGFVKSCNSLEEVYKEAKINCKSAFANTMFNRKDKDDTIYTFLSMAEISSWIAFLGTASALGIYSFLIFGWCQNTRAQRKPEDVSSTAPPRYT